MPVAAQLAAKAAIAADVKKRGAISFWEAVTYPAYSYLICVKSITITDTTLCIVVMKKKTKFNELYFLVRESTALSLRLNSKLICACHFFNT